MTLRSESETRLVRVDDITAEELDARGSTIGAVRRATVFLGERNFPKYSSRILISAVGASGCGKSSALNWLLRTDAFSVSHVDAGTLEMQSLEVALRTGKGHCLSFVDMPGLSESKDADAKYHGMYSWIIPRSALLLYFAKADERAISHHQKIFTKFFSDSATRERVVLVVGKSDLIEPFDPDSPQVTTSQKRNLTRRIDQLRASLGVQRVIPISVRLDFNLPALASEIESRINWPAGPLV